MRFVANEIYHIYNRGNNRNEIFFNKKNYSYFLNKLRDHFLVHFDLLAYCLMPNHFHLLALSKESIVNKKAIASFALILSSYSQGINKQEKRTGSIFQKKTKAKSLGTNISYLGACLRYIHQNPCKAKLADKFEDWEFSSFRDYAGLRNDSLCNITTCFELLSFEDKKEFYEWSNLGLDEDLIKNIF